MDLVDGRFTLETLLGRGGFGEAHLARDRDGQSVVLKLLHAEHAQDGAITERFRREVVALERLRHRNVVPLVAHGFCGTRGRPYYAMEFSPGESLDKVLEREKRLSLGRALGLLDQLLSALEAAHSLGIVHRDLKPANLLLEPGGSDETFPEANEKLRVIDFGLAKHTKGGSRTVADLTGDSRLGSPAYMSPEQCQGLPATAKADIYSTGCILMQLVTGRVPFEARGVLELLQHHAETRAPRLDSLLPGAPPLLVDLVDRCLEKHPESRPDASTLRAGLARVARESAGGSTSSSETGALGGSAGAATTLDEKHPSAGAALTVEWPAPSGPSRHEGVLATGVLPGAVPPTRVVEPRPLAPPVPLSPSPPPVASPSPPVVANAPRDNGSREPTGPRPAPHAPRASRDPKPGEQLGGYLLERTLGEGGFGRVFLTTLADGSKAAVKVLLPSDPNDPVESDKRFRREAHLLQSLDHPAFPKVYDFGVEGPLSFAVIEFIEGEDLAHLLERERRVPLERLLKILRQILPGLDFAHARGVVHCDLKPGNVRLRDDGRAFLLDLGIAKIREGSALGGRSIQTLAGLAFGTFEYLAPELAHGRQDASPAADVYSLGVLLFECLSGRLPFLDRDPLRLVQAHERSAPPDLAGLAPGVPIAVCDLVHRCLAKKPDQRPATAGELLREIELAVAPPLSEAPASRPTGRRVSVLVPKSMPAATVDVAPPAVPFPFAAVEAPLGGLSPGVAAEAASLARGPMAHARSSGAAEASPSSSPQAAPPSSTIPPTRVSPSAGPAPSPGAWSRPPAPAESAPALSPTPTSIPATRVSPATAASEAATLPPNYRPAPRPDASLPSAVLVPPPERSPSEPVPIPAPRPAAAPARTRVVAVPDSFVSGRAAPAPPMEPSPAPDPRITLSDFGPEALAVCVLSGKSAGLVQVVEGLRGELAIGRDPSAFLVLAADEDQVSRRHAALVVHASGVSIRELDGKAHVEGTPAGVGGLPLARGAIVRLGEPGVLLVLETLARVSDKKAPPGAILKRVDRHAPKVVLDGPRLLGRAPEAATVLQTERDVLASNRHAQITPRAGLLVLEDLGSANGTFVNGKRVFATLLKTDDEIALGGPEGPRFLVEIPPPPTPSMAETLPPPNSQVITLPPVYARPRTAKLGVSREPLPDSGDAIRGKLEVEFQGQKGVLFLFAGTRLRFGRNSNRGVIENDLVLRAFPRAKNEDPKLVEARTRDVSGHHGAFVLTRDGIAVRDDGSKLGSELDGAKLAAHELVPVKEQFVLEIAKVVALRGRVIRAADTSTGERLPGVDASHPVEALRLERTRDGEHMSYVLLVREVTIGSGEYDAVFLPHPEVKPGHARLAVRRGRLAVGAHRGDAPVTVAGRALAVGELVDLESGVEVGIGGARLRYSTARDDDMKP